MVLVRAGGVSVNATTGGVLVRRWRSKWARQGSGVVGVGSTDSRVKPGGLLLVTHNEAVGNPVTPCVTGIMRTASVRASETEGKMKMDIKIDR